MANDRHATLRAAGHACGVACVHLQEIGLCSFYL